MDRQLTHPAGMAGTARAAQALEWRGAATVAVVMIAIIAIRLHELVPAASLVKPGLLAAFGGAGLVLYHSTPAARTRLFRHPLFRVTALYWAFMVVTVPLAMWPGLAFGTVQYFMPGVALVMAILLCRPERRSLVLLQGGLVVAAALYALYARLFGRVFGDGRISAGVGMYDSNDMAAILGMAFPLAVGLFMTQRGRLRWVAAFGALLLAAVVVASGSRGGLLGLGAGALVLTLGLKGPARVLALAAFVAAFAGMWTLSPSFNERVRSMTALEADYNTTHEVGRKAVWKRGRQYIRENPVIGVGAGNFPVAEGRYFDITYEGTRGGKWSSAHNAYVQAFAELGVIGGTLFITLLLYGVRAAWRLWRGVRLASGALAHRPELFASLCAFMVSAVFLSHAYFLPLMALLGIIALNERALALAGPVEARRADARLAARRRRPATPGGAWVPQPAVPPHGGAPLTGHGAHSSAFRRRRPGR